MRFHLAMERAENPIAHHLINPRGWGWVSEAASEFTHD